MAQIGLKDLHFAILTKDTKNELVYEPVEPLIEVMTANVNTNVNTAELYADDRLCELISTFVKAEVTIETTSLPLATRAKILGHTYENGVLMEKSTDVPPYLAMGFKSLKSNGKYRYVWLLKGMAEPLSEEYASKKDGIDYKTSNLKLIFMSRAHDDEWRLTADEDGEGSVNNATWFAKVPGDPTGVIVIKTQPEDATVTEGFIVGELTVAAVAVGATNIGYQWYSNSINSNVGGTKIADEKSAAFDIPEELTAGTYYYYCEITADGAKAVVSDVATVTVEDGE